MTQTSTEPPQAPAPGGWNTDNLRDYRTLRRSRDDRKVAGVAGGLGRHLDMDPTILRVLFFVLIFFGGAGLVMYAAMWLLVPEEGTEKAAIGASDSLRNALLIGVAVVAVLLVASDVATGYGFPWGLLVVGSIVAVVLLIRDRRRPAVDVSTSMPPPGPAAAAGGTDTLVTPAPEYAQTAPQYGPPPGSPPAPPYVPPPLPPRPRDPRRTGPLLFGPTLAVLALALGILGIADVAGASVSGTAYAAVAVGVIGAMLVIGAFVGRAGGLILLGLIAIMTLVATAIGGPTYQGSRDQAVQPTSAEQVSDSYYVPAGRIIVDLTQVRQLRQLDGRHIDISANAGHLVLIVPPDVTATYKAHIQYGGSISTPTTNRDGWGPRVIGRVGSPDAKAQIQVDLHEKFGDIEVQQS